MTTLRSTVPVYVWSAPFSVVDTNFRRERSGSLCLGLCCRLMSLRHLLVTSSARDIHDFGEVRMLQAVVLGYEQATGLLKRLSTDYELPSFSSNYIDCAKTCRPLRWRRPNLLGSCIKTAYMYQVYVYLYEVRCTCRYLLLTHIGKGL